MLDLTPRTYKTSLDRTGTVTPGIWQGNRQQCWVAIIPKGGGINIAMGEKKSLTGTRLCGLTGKYQGKTGMANEWRN